MTDPALDWQIAVFCQNEQGRVASCLKSISTAVGLRRALITLIVNGSGDDSEQVAREAMASIPTPVRIFRIAYGDKSNAINSFLYAEQIRAVAGLYFFIDGYAAIRPGSLSAMAEALSDHPTALAATGIAATGRSEPRSHLASQNRGGALHGQFFVLRRAFVDRMAGFGFRLPVGLYRGDGLLGSMAAHDLDCLAQPWVNDRIISVPDALFETEPLSPFRFRDLSRQFRRKVRQMRGRLENAAIKQVIYRGGYAALPEFADDLIREFLASNPVPTVPLTDRPFMALALRQHCAAITPSRDSLRPTRVV